MHTIEQDAPALTQILGEIRRLQSRKDDLWSVEDIAAFLKLSKGSVSAHIVGKKQRGFPPAIVLPTGGKRWVAGEVRAWALKQARHS